jgi:hypothetical protein
VSASQSIARLTPMTNFEKCHVPILSKPKSLPKSGIIHRRAGLGIRNMAERLGLRGNPRNGCAFNAGKHISRWRGATQTSSVRQGAGTIGIMPTEPILRNGRVPIAVGHSRPTSIADSNIAPTVVVGVRDAGRATVYNLRVEGASEFFANGVLVHNCDALAMSYAPRRVGVLIG